MSRPAARLGRGLASLIPDSALDTSDPSLAPRNTLRHVPIDEVRPNPEQPRDVFKAEELESLADSIRTHGVLAPLVVRREQGRYVLIAGERRLRAAALAGLSEVPVILRDAPGAREQLELALVENLQRADLDPVETARGYERLSHDFGMTQDEVARRVGCDRSTVANTMRLLKLPEVALSALRDGRISSGHARALIPLANAEDDLRQVLAKVLAQGLNVRATEKLVAQVSATPRPLRAAAQRKREQTFDYATQLLSRSLQTAVEIRPLAKGGGHIVIDYSSADELERLIQRLRQEG
jgi:ParB family chromosome partitioning protein